jgi:hypothetical protein
MAGSTTGAKNASHLGASRAAKAGAGKVATFGPTEANAEAPAVAPTSQSNSVAHPHDKGHEKQLPSAAAHGQQTAASHKAANHGHAGTRGHPAHPSKPAHPTHPSKPSAEKGAPSPPSTPVAPESHPHGNVATPDAGAEEALAEDETGKKP